MGVLLAIGIAGYRLAHHGPRPFDHEVWVEGDEDVWPAEAPRLRMADYLLLTKALDNKSKDEVLGMLGSPSTSGYFKDWGLVYWLGPERGFFGIDSEWLVMRFDQNGRVAEAQIVRD